MADAQTIIMYAVIEQPRRGQPGVVALHDTLWDATEHADRLDREDDYILYFAADLPVEVTITPITDQMED